MVGKKPKKRWLQVDLVDSIGNVPFVCVNSFSCEGSSTEKYRSFVCSLARSFVVVKFFRSCDFVFSPLRKFSKTRSARRDRFRPKIVKIGAILAMFRPFEVSALDLSLDSTLDSNLDSTSDSTLDSTLDSNLDSTLNSTLDSILDSNLDSY